MDASPGIEKLENDLIESNEKVKALCESNSRLELLLNDSNNKLEQSVKKCNEILNDNEKLSAIEDDLSRQVIFNKI